MLWFVVWTFITAWAGSPSTLVALGDGRVAGEPAQDGAQRATVRGGWVTALVDCLEEKSPGAFAVVNLGREGDGPEAVRERLDEALGHRPEVVLLGVTASPLRASTPEAASWEPALQAVLEAVAQADATVLLVGATPVLVSEGQPELDARVAELDASLARIASERASVHHIDLLSAWPRAADARAALAVDGWQYSDQGHARVAAEVCKTVLALPQERHSSDAVPATGG